MTPDELRKLADDYDEPHGARHRREIATALRWAADELERLMKQVSDSRLWAQARVRERDEARAQIERLGKSIEADAKRALILVRERDEARAEVELLKQKPSVNWDTLAQKQAEEAWTENDVLRAQLDRAVEVLRLYADIDYHGEPDAARDVLKEIGRDDD